MKNILVLNSDNIARQAALVSDCDGKTLLNVDNALVMLYKNGGKGVERACKLPLKHRFIQGLIKLEIPLTEEDSDTIGCLCIFVNKSGSLNSCGLFDIYRII